jgi:hypothetical protein
MSTFPLVQVEGALAMPRMRPLNRVPPPFGRDWALMPPHFSLRTELRALYAAFIRTVCLSAEAFREAYRWDSHRRFIPEPPRPTAAPISSALNAAQAQQAAAETLQRPAAGARSVRTAHVERTPPQSHKLTASAVAIGGAALLAWIVASHTQFGEDNDKSVLRAPSSPASNAGANSSARLADERTQHGHAVLGIVRSQQGVDSPASATTTGSAAPVAATRAARDDVESGVAIGPAVVVPRAAPAGIAAQGSPSAPVAAERAQADGAAPRQGAAPTPLVTSRALPTHAIAGAPVTTSRAGSSLAGQPDFTARAYPDMPQRASVAPKATRAGHATAKVAKATKGRHTTETNAARAGTGRHAAHEFAPHRTAPLATTHRTHGMYSEAAEYSPRQPVANSDDEYASLATYATTRTAPRSGGRASMNVESTEWVNHVSQRRVTEVPDSFAK